jgi:GT2 family glycosyltransferase
MPVWNKLELTQRAIQSIRDNTTVPYRLIVIDNGSSDGTAAWLAEQRDIKRVITFRENQGFAPAINAGLRVCTLLYVVMFSNDVEVDTGWLELLVEGLESNPEIGAIGPLSTAKIDRQWEGYHRAMNGVQTVSYWLALFCALFRARAIQDVGELDERFVPGYGEDNDYFYRMRLASWDSAVHCDVLVKHNHQVITPEQEELRAIARQRLREKWPNAQV